MTETRQGTWARKPYRRGFSLPSAAGIATLLFLLVIPVEKVQAVTLYLPGLVSESTGPVAGTFDPEKFRGLLQQLADLMVPIYTDGGNTSGALGFEVGVGWGVGVVSDESAGWEQGTRDSSGSVNTLEFGVRKGLPWATEVGAFMSNIDGSSIWAFGLEMEASPVEGLAHIPDISIATGLGSATGTGDLNMLMASSRLTLSKSFAPSPTIALIPFGGFQYIFVRGSIPVLSKVRDDVSEDSNDFLSELLPPPTVGHITRGFGGIRGLVGPLTVALVGGMSNVAQRVALEFGLRY